MSLPNDPLNASQSSQAIGASLISVAGGLIERAGGLQGLVAMLQQQGLGKAVQSWVSIGANKAVSSRQLGQALQKGGLGSVIQEAAGKVGVDPNQLLGQLSQVLPHVVDHLTPKGEVPAQGQSGLDLSSLGALADKLLGSKPA
ncbi:YidB family protein [Dyella japonica]|uniref:Uncharacterized protein YidB (DUF937 family) n=1 Tax=Dyella japonica TaxID=231455 RepID=A0ABV2K146_9GAMM